ncbi:MAG: XRE family transcriptional regulator [Bacillus sp. (in: firmicutes)]
MSGYSVNQLMEEQQGCRNMLKQQLKNILADNLKRLLDRRKISQKDLARDLHLPVMTVSNWMTGKTYPRCDKVLLLANYFGVRMAELLEDVESVAYKSGHVADYPYVTYRLNNGTDDVYGICSMGSIAGVQDCTANMITLPDVVMGGWAGNKEIFLMRMYGDAMNRIFSDNTLLMMKQSQLADLDDNDVVLYYYKGNYVLRRYYRDDARCRVIFRPESDNFIYTDTVIDFEDMRYVQVLGKVVGYLGMLSKE